MEFRLLLPKMLHNLMIEKYVTIHGIYFNHMSTGLSFDVIDKVYEKSLIITKMSHLMTKPTKWHVRPANTPPSLITVFAVPRKKAWVLSYLLSAQRRLISQGIQSDWADAQADLSLLWAHSHFVGFVMRWLK